LALLLESRIAFWLTCVVEEMMMDWFDSKSSSDWRATITDENFDKLCDSLRRNDPKVEGVCFGNNEFHSCDVVPDSRYCGVLCDALQSNTRVSKVFVVIPYLVSIWKKSRTNVTLQSDLNKFLEYIAGSSALRTVTLEMRTR
jgi:hypothetical protein